jgi:hypothetical protein
MTFPSTLTLGEIRNLTSDLSDDTPVFVRIERIMVRPEVGYVVNDIEWDINENDCTPKAVCLVHIPKNINNEKD